MLTQRDPIDELVGALARVRDDELASASDSGAAEALFEEVVSMPSPATGVISPAAPLREAPRRRRTRTIALLTAAVLALGAGATYAATQWLSPREQLSAVGRLAQDIPLPPGGNFDAVRAGITGAQAQQEERGRDGGLPQAAGPDDRPRRSGPGPPIPHGELHR